MASFVGENILGCALSRQGYCNYKSNRQYIQTDKNSDQAARMVDPLTSKFRKALYEFASECTNTMQGKDDSADTHISIIITIS